MPDIRISPPLRLLQLGRTLTALRAASGLTCQQVATRLEWSASKVSRLERGANNYATAGDVQRLLDVYNVEDPDIRDDCLRLLRTAHITPPWAEHKRGLGGLVEYVALETEAQTIRHWHPLLIPGQLQTEAYARAVISAGMVEKDETMLTLRVRARLARQWITKCEDPVHVYALIGEQVLQQRIGGTAVMSEQLDRLVSDSRRPNIDIRVIPQEAAVGLSSGFVLLSLLNLGEVLFIEAGTAGIIDQGPRVGEFERRFDYFRSLALPPDESVALIMNVRKGFPC
ncbi:helix-turn-helix domain-containing protein [Nonomuraea endophytica]|uniref:helix-turn-helix domain-containing protein n=1 Tax=Nonomuraea endophytica TaxID=714136 RepID=UPI0037CA3613